MSLSGYLSKLYDEVRAPFEFAPELEKAYKEAAYATSILMLRIAIGLGGSLYLSFSWLDVCKFPEIYMSIWMVRGFILFCFAGAFYLTFQSFFVRIHQPVLFWLMVILTGGQFVMLYFTNSDEGHSYFFTGLLLIMACAYGLTQLNLTNCLILCTYMLITYILMGVYSLEWTAQGWFVGKGLVIVESAFFLISMNVIGVVIYITVQYFRRKGSDFL